MTNKIRYLSIFDLFYLEKVKEAILGSGKTFSLTTLLNYLIRKDFRELALFLKQAYEVNIWVSPDGLLLFFPETEKTAKILRKAFCEAKIEPLFYPVDFIYEDELHDVFHYYIKRYYEFLTMDKPEKGATLLYKLFAE